MNKGLSLIETLTAMLILSIILVIMLGFVRAGHGLFTKSFKDFVIRNDYDEFISYFSKDFKNLKQIKEIENNELTLLLKNDTPITYKITRDENKLKIIRQDKEIEFKNIIFNNVYLEGYDKKGNKTTLAEKIIFIKIFIGYLDNKVFKHYSFELFEIII